MAYDDNPGDQTAPWVNYVCVPSSFADAGDTGLTTSKAYIALRIEDLDSLTEAQANDTTGSCKQIIFALLKEFYDWYNALAAADKPAKLTVQQTSGGSVSDGTILTIRHEITSTHAASTTVADE